METEKQKQILLLLSEGHTAVEIGAKIKRSKKTVEKHLEILRAVYGAKNSPHLIGIALRTGIIQ